MQIYYGYYNVGLGFIYSKGYDLTVMCVHLNFIARFENKIYFLIVNKIT